MRPPLRFREERSCTSAAEVTVVSCSWEISLRVKNCTIREVRGFRSVTEAAAWDLFGFCKNAMADFEYICIAAIICSSQPKASDEGRGMRSTHPSEPESLASQ